jgi:hypothetical protein
MSRNGIQGGTLAPSLPYVLPISSACNVADFFPSVTYAICWRESISGEVDGLWADAAQVLSPDGGHGLGQLTSSFPTDWADPYKNVLYAIDEFLKPAEVFWAAELQGDNLVRAIAAEYNAGRSDAIKGHAMGNLDLYTTNGYAAAVLSFYHTILATGRPAR